MNDNHKQAYCPSLCTVAGRDLISANDNPMPAAKMREWRLKRGWNSFAEFLAVLGLDAR